MQPPVICVAKPSVVHFGGFQLHRPHRQMCRIMNTSMRTQRFTIHNPTTPYFRARQSKLGAVAPGMWEEVTLEFTPDEHRYYYDSIRVVSEGSDPVVVPIHAYPVVNTAEFPTAIDFGKCSLSESMCKVVPLSSSVPIEFEFELRIIKPSAFFEVSPLSGIIPANGKVDIRMNFHPLQLHSAQMNIEVHISQYDFEPFVCSLTGVGLPETDSSEPLPLQLHPLRTREIPTRTRRKIEIRRPLPPPSDEPITVEGIMMPAHLGNVHAVSSVLTSEPGKLKLKDLKAALADQANQEGAVQGRQLREAVFMKTLSDEIDRERNVEIRPALPNCEVQTWGDTPKSQAQLEQIARERADAFQEVIDRQHAEGRNRVVTEATDGRPVHNAKAVPMFYKPCWELESDQGEADSTPALRAVQQQLVNLAAGLMIGKKVDSRISALRAHLASFGSKEEISLAISGDSATTQSEEKDTKKSTNFCGVPSQPGLPLFREQELGAPDPVKTKDLSCFDDREPLPLEVPKYFELMEYEPIKELPVPAYLTIETSKLLESGAEEEDLIRGWRAPVVRPATALLPTGPPGALMSHEATVLAAPPRQPVHTIPEHAREPVPFNTWDMIKPQNRVRAYSELLRCPETSCESLLRPVAPDTSVSSLEEACGSNAVLAMWQLPTHQDVMDHSSARLTRPWFNDNVPMLLAGPTAEMEECQDEAAAPAEDEEEEMEPINVPHPYQENVETLAKKLVEIRAGWSARLEEGLTRVNDTLVNPKIKLK